MGQSGMQLESGLVDPLRVNREEERFVERLEDVDTQATCLLPGQLDHLQDLLPELRLFACQRLKLNQKVNGQTAPPELSCPTRRPVPLLP